MNCNRRIINKHIFFLPSGLPLWNFGKFSFVCILFKIQYTHYSALHLQKSNHQIQGTDVCLQDHNWHCTNIPKLASSNLCALQKLAFCKWTTSCGAIPKRYQITLTDLYLDCAQLVERPPNLNSNSWVFSHFQKTSKDTSFSPAPD